MNTRDDINQDDDLSLQREIESNLTDVDPKTRALIEEWAKKLVDLSRRKEAEHASDAGFTDDTVRTISENAKTPRFKDFGWERD